MKNNTNPPALAISHARNAAKRNSFYRESELKFALFDNAWQFMGNFTSIGSAQEYVDRHENCEAWVNGPQVVDL